MKFLSDLLSIISGWLERQNFKLKEKNSAKMKQREEAQALVNAKNEAEILLEKIKVDKQKTLDEIRKRIAS